MKLFYFLAFLLIAISCNSNSCDYAVYDFYKKDSEKPYEGFQIILHSVLENRLELIGNNYETKLFWDFNKGDSISINDSLKIYLDEKNLLNDGEQEDFYSRELNDNELNYLLKTDIKKISIYRSQVKYEAILTNKQSQTFKSALNCNFTNDKIKLKRLLDEN